ncbi:MAG: cytochrome P450 [Chloroflexi bacterium]|nr:cytochrome P450 [Chloroflexota bacterium]
MENPMDAIVTNIDPFPFYQEFRRTQPVYYNTERGSWNIFRYHDVQRALSDFAVFSSKFSLATTISSDEPFAASMISSDPPRHRQLRTLVTQAFTPHAVENLAPRILAIVTEHLDRVMDAGRFDAIRDLGYPLPVIVIAELMGIPPADRERFKTWSDTIVSFARFGENIDPRVFQSNAILEMAAYFLELIERRRKEPGDDLISGLLKAEIDGQRLSQIELLGFCSLLLVAGNETTTNLIGNAMLTFTDRPEDWQRLRGAPELVPQAIEEVLRYRSPVQAMFRLVKQEVKIGGQVLPPGARIVAWIGSANHDEARFPDAEEFDIDRQPNRHLAFGHGIHYCLGAPLARLEAKIALTSMLERFATIERAAEFPVERMPSMIVYGTPSLVLNFSRS